MKYFVTIIFILIYAASDAQILFNKIYEKPYYNYADAVIERTDGNIFVLGSSRNPTDTDFVIILSLIDPEGNLLWDKYFAGTRRGSSLIQTSDANFLAVGTASNSTTNAYLVKFNSDGNKIWEQSYTSSTFMDGFSVGETLNNNYYFVGTDGETSILYLTDTSGNLIWSSSYEIGKLVSVIQTLDGGFILAGTTVNPSIAPAIVLLKVDSQGNEMWSKLFGDGVYDGAQSVLQLPDGGYMIAGHFAEPDVSHGYPLSYFIRTNSVGDTLWTKKQRIGLSNHIKPLKNQNGFIHSSSFYSHDYFSINISKLDEFAEIVWTRNFEPGFLFTIGNNITETADGGFLITCATSDFSIESDIRLIKLDADGNFVPLSVNDFNEKKSGLTLFPNPASNIITFQLDENYGNSINKLIIYDAVGKVLKKLDAIDKYKMSLEINDLSSGIYFFELITHLNDAIKGRFIVEK